MATANKDIDAPQQRHFYLKRRVILEGAKRVFMVGGYGATSMDAVAEAAGVSKVTVYRYFSNKEALFSGVVEDECKKMMEGNLSTEMVGLSTAKALTLFARRFVAIVFDPEIIVLHRIVIAEAARFPELGRLFYESGPQRNINVLTGYLTEHIDKSHHSIEEPIQAAESFLDQLRGYNHLRVLLGVAPVLSAVQREALIVRVVREFLDGRPGAVGPKRTSLRIPAISPGSGC